MKPFILPVVLALFGAGAGAGAGIFFKSTTEVSEELITNPCGDAPETAATTPVEELEPGAPRDFARLNNQFIIPVVEDGRVTSLVVMSLQLEVRPGRTESVFTVEPKLRDGFLQDMFNPANIGGFSGNFTTGSNMRRLRNELLQTARRIIGDDVTDVLITDIVRQDA